MKEPGLFEKIEECSAALSKRNYDRPSTAIILGTGLGGLAAEIQVQVKLAYEELPHFPLSTVESHHGFLLLGKLEGHAVAAFQGRFHLYEGYDAGRVTFPVRLAKALGCSTLIVSNAAGGIAKGLKPGSLCLIEDHINLQSSNPLTGVHDDRLGARWPDLFHCYSPDLLARAEAAARELGIALRRGVYAAVNGPNLETPAEYRMLRTLGADLVGMSTVPEVIVAAQSGMKALGLSVITDECDPETVGPVDIRKILAAAHEAEPRLTALIKKIVKGL